MFGKNLTSKHGKNKISLGSNFSYILYGKNENPEMPEINRELFKSKNTKC